ncbi:MAG TPA: saccharopine dehydrogenase NADP-binding domain-containing protein [Thermoanaerobaculia bacterium]|nr:saccharopine dehydrogenase NADP-binding domain-containing protein [Thermoanaerobaculia bacterium]
MAPKQRVVVIGGSGVFGRLFVRELRQWDDFQLVIAGRDRHAAERIAAEAGVIEVAQLDVRDLAALRHVASGAFAVVCLAGPFQALDHHAPEAVVDSGAHWLDISDDPTWVDNILTSIQLREKSLAAHLSVIPGLSSTPALSGVLARLGRRELADATEAAITLFIGNKNVKGAGAIASAISAVPRRRHSRPVIDLPFGSRRTLPFDSPDALLLARELGLEAHFSVAFESAVATALIRIARALPMSGSAKTSLAKVLSVIAAPSSRFGSDAGGVDALITSRSGESRRLRFSTRGQRLAILPAVLALRELAGSGVKSGCVTPAETLPLDIWVERLEREGVMLSRSDRSSDRNSES